MTPMDHFVDVVLRTDPELPTHILLGAVYAKAHQWLVSQRSTDIAICFPEYSLRPPSLGRRLRLLSSQNTLQLMMQSNWVYGLQDFVSLSAVVAVPESVEHRTLRRVQVKSSPERLRRRLMKRHGLDAAEARARLPDSLAATLPLPYIHVQSRSTQQSFRLFLQLGPPVPERVDGAFNSYGLGQAATVPWF